MYYDRMNLQHHGIKGQKWGVRRYQNPDGSLTAAGRKRAAENNGGRKGDSSKSPNSSNNVNTGKATVDKMLSGNKAGMSDEGVVLAIQLGTYTATMLGVYAYTKIKEKKEKKEFDEELQYKYSKRDIESLDKAPKLKKPMSAADSMKVVNPDYPNGDTVQNCIMCTMAMAMREKGYDVKANTSPHGFYDENANKFFKNGGQLSKIKAKKSSDIINQLNTEGDGAYGNLVVKWQLGGAHSVFWKNEGGKTRIYDGQSGQEYDVENPKFSKFLKSISAQGARYSRLDNAEPDELILAALQKNKQ